MTDDPYATARTYHVRSQDLGHDPKFDDDATSLWLALRAAEPGRIYDSAAGWKAAAGRLAGLADLLRTRIAPALAEAWGGEAATASQTAFQKLHATAESLSSTSNRMADALETTAGKLTEARTGLPDDMMDVASDKFTQWELQRRFWQLESHYVSDAPYQMPTTVSANLPGINGDGRGEVGGYNLDGDLGSGIGGAPWNVGTGGTGGGHAFAGYRGGVTSGGIPAGSPFGPGGTDAGAMGSPSSGGGWDGSDVPSANSIPVGDGYVPVGSDTDLAGLDGSPYSGGQLGAAGYAPGGSGSSGFGSLSGSGFGAGGVGTGGGSGVPGLGGVPGARAGGGGNEVATGRGGSGLGGRGASGVPTGGGPGMVPPTAAAGEDDEEWERESWLGEDADVWRSNEAVSPAVIGQAEEEPPERPERRRRRRS